MKSKTKSVDEVKATRLITAIKTPYLPDGKVDLAMYDALVEKQIAAGIGGLIVGGTTLAPGILGSHLVEPSTIA